MYYVYKPIHVWYLVYIILGYIKERILGSDGMNLFDAWPEMLPRKYLCKWGDGLWLHFATSMLQWPYLTNNVQISLTNLNTTRQTTDNNKRQKLLVSEIKLAHCKFFHSRINTYFIWNKDTSWTLCFLHLFPVNFTQSVNWHIVRMPS